MTVGEDTPHSIATRLRTASLEDHNCGNIFDGEKEPRCAKRGSKFRGKAGHRGERIRSLSFSIHASGVRNNPAAAPGALYRLPFTPRGDVRQRYEGAVSR